MDKEIELALPWNCDEFKVQSGCQVDAWPYVWKALLCVHANLEGMDKALLFRCIKDARSNMNRAKTMKLTYSLTLYDQHDYEEEYMEDSFYNSDDPSAPDGTKLARLVINEASEWKDLHTTREGTPHETCHRL